MSIEAARRVFREGFAPLLSTADLIALRDAASGDDPRLIQGVTAKPMLGLAPCSGACAIGFVGLTHGITEVEDVCDFFAQMCYAIDDRVGEPAGCRYFIGWYDSASRHDALASLAAWCEEELRTRAAAAKGGAA